ncbi:zinc transporter 2 [Scaptodrosophila lebanonensis]|uniref:Zinc transporter 2 n=1 Tax=Drosophila lebanonensis TaxID=7225 RepID=A0A6J2U973_DROLE|nr:zinc transporter 2 [Scaptodrosophila lebanonensis]
MAENQQKKQPDDDDSEDEEAMIQAMQELLKIPDIDPAQAGTVAPRPLSPTSRATTVHEPHSETDGSAPQTNTDYEEKLHRIWEASKPKRRSVLHTMSTQTNEKEMDTKSLKVLPKELNRQSSEMIEPSSTKCCGVGNILGSPFCRIMKATQPPERKLVIDESHEEAAGNANEDNRGRGSGERKSEEPPPSDPPPPPPVSRSSDVPNEKKSEVSEQRTGKQLRRSDSMRTLTIVGHSHITTYRDHCHRDQTKQGMDKTARRKLIVACVLCLVFMIIEVIGGILSKSLAIAADAAHLLSDLAAFLISLFALYVGARPSTQRMNFGWYRAEVIGAMISVYLIWVITLILVWLAIQRLWTGEHDVDAIIMLITSALGFLFNLIMAIQLTHGHSHSHGHSHKPRKPKVLKIVTSEKTLVNAPMDATKQNLITSVSMHFAHGHSHGSPNDNINVRAAIIHVVGDMIQSIGIFIAALIIFFKPEWAFVDSICTFIFSIIVVVTTIAIMRDVLLVLMEATPDYMDYEEVRQTFMQIEGVEHVHNLRIWAISADRVALSAHLAISKTADSQEILEEATTLIHRKHDLFETTLQIEEYKPGMKTCDQCLNPTRQS